jgi:hypothetical protein
MAGGHQQSSFSLMGSYSLAKQRGLSDEGMPVYLNSTCRFFHRKGWTLDIPETVWSQLREAEAVSMSEGMVNSGKLY